ncbi:hypothetical protein AAFF_G00077590 [Aldrovandia affinis]|uniref:Uncharacterized protein n=1 Tax=Aldrovandia affinis TaxID=143900 RepID=A0AAD7RXG0_9TELE|nr:hypothetical protein AAFF_G00077590 [Aldrovandia affinis]
MALRQSVSNPPGASALRSARQQSQAKLMNSGDACFRRSLPRVNPMTVRYRGATGRARVGSSRPGRMWERPHKCRQAVSERDLFPVPLACDFSHRGPREHFRRRWVLAGAQVLIPADGPPDPTTPSHRLPGVSQTHHTCFSLLQSLQLSSHWLGCLDFPVYVETMASRRPGFDPVGAGGGPEVGTWQWGGGAALVQGSSSGASDALLTGYAAFPLRPPGGRTEAPRKSGTGVPLSLVAVISPRLAQFHTYALIDTVSSTAP